MVSMAAGLLFAGLLSAQLQVSIPYQMSFEEADSAEWVNWHINEGATPQTCRDYWMVGEDQHSDGKRSLYISDNGFTAHFGAARNIQFAYRDFQLPQGNYIVAFDWKNVGSANSTLYVGCGPVTTSLSCQAITNGQPLPSGYTMWCQPATSDLKGQRYWQNARLTGVNANGTRTMRLYFAWVNTNTDTTLFSPLGACIDNVQICKANAAPPTNITAETGCDSTIVRWTGTSDNYQLGYRRVGETQWHNRHGLSAVAGNGEVIIEGMEEGMYDFRVRGILGNDTSVYTYLNSVVLFCPEAHCINYVNVGDTSGQVICKYGTVGNSGAINPGNTRIGCVDYGPDDMYSRHTVNWDITAHDKNTNNKLPKIPDGELATVRLGNWRTGAEWESVSYNYLVDSVYSILLLKYAVVLEDPGHDLHEQPRFTLSIKDQAGNEVDPTCGSADFHAGQSSGNKGSGWHQEVIPDPTYPSSTTTVTWKEWTTYGIDLTQYVGQTLSIVVTTYDCTLSGHFGYGYFCLGCAKAKIEGVSCGDDAKMTAQAPDGFAYSWSSIHNIDSIISTDRTLEVEASDTSTYRCRLTYLDQADCYFDLYSAVFPRFPVAALSYKYEPTNCENRVVFTNLSHIMTKYEGDTTGTHHNDEPCEDYEWVVNGERFSDKNLIYVFPQTGGQFPVTLFAAIANGKCTDDTTFVVDIPAIGDVHLDLYDTICYGNRYIFGGDPISTTGTYTKTFHSRAGCDSICTLNLLVRDEVPTTFGNMDACKGIPLVVDGDVFPYGNTLGKHQWIRRKSNVYGCDSTVVLDVMVHPMLEPTVQGVMPYICAPGEGELVTLVLPFELEVDSALTAVVVHTNAAAQTAGFEASYTFDLNSIKSDTVSGQKYVEIPVRSSADKHWPGTYDFTLEFQSTYHCDVEMPTRVEVRHTLNAVSQIYGYMFVQNDSLNGGYHFTSFQWYKNGRPMIGENSYYIEVDDDNKDSVFYCMVSWNDGDTVSTCPIRYDWTTSDPKEWAKGVPESGLTDLGNVNAEIFCVPSLAAAGSNVYVTTNEALQVFDLLGRRISSYPKTTESRQMIVAPHTPGVYFVKSKSGATARIVVE